MHAGCMHGCMIVCACMQAWVHAWMHAWMHGCMHACMYACVHACMYACMYACMLCMRAYLHMQRSKAKKQSKEAKQSKAQQSILEASPSRASWDGRRWIPLEKLICLLEKSLLYTPVRVFYGHIGFLMDFDPACFAGSNLNIYIYTYIIPMDP